jgi:hypothetical protein
LLVSCPADARRDGVGMDAGDGGQGLSHGEVGIVLVRALMSGIPVVGGASDVLMSGWLEHRRRRLEDVSTGLQQGADAAQLLAAVREDPAVLDLWLRAAEAGQRSRVARARVALGRVVAKGATRELDWDEADLLVDALAELREPHVELLVRIDELDRRARDSLGAVARNAEVWGETKEPTRAVATEYPVAIHQTLLRHGLAESHGMSLSGVSKATRPTALGRRLLRDLDPA